MIAIKRLHIFMAVWILIFIFIPARCAVFHQSRLLCQDLQASSCLIIVNSCVKRAIVIKNTNHGVSRSTDLTVAAKRHEVSPSEEHATKEPIQQQIHRMFLLRVKLMHFVNSLHNYIMTRVGFLYGTGSESDSWIFKSHILILSIYVQILHSTGLEFQHQVQEAKDLDQLIKVHYRYLSTIHDRCLLREKVHHTLVYKLYCVSLAAVIIYIIIIIVSHCHGDLGDKAEDQRV